MTTAPHLAIRASAGSGKTFQLTNRLLSLLIGGVPLDRIVAATFTRKAAGEILERVLKRLASGAADERSARELSQQVGVPPVGRNSVLELLASLTARLHDLRIGTLDSLFADLASSLGVALGLPPQWRILDAVEDGELRDKAIGGLLAKGRTSDLVALLRLLTKGDTARSVKQQIRNAVDELYSVFRTTDESHWAPFRIPPLMEADKLELAIADFERVPLPKHKTWQKAHQHAVEAARRLDWKAFLGETLVQRVLDGSEDYARTKIDDGYRESCLRLTEHAKGAVLVDLHKQTKAVYRLLDHFHAEYAPLKSGRQAFLFEDVTDILVRSKTNPETPDAAYRLGARTQHLLLDEFQDTSSMQWQVVESAAHSIAGNSEDHGFFCVGDEKQAIYGWRGGSADLFGRLERDIPSLEWTDLATSYRSAPTVIEAVNAVFQPLAANPIFQNDNRESAAVAAEEWASRFTPHTTARKELTGYVCFHSAPMIEVSEEKSEPDVYGFAARWIAAEHAKRPKATIGVLTRKNSGVARMIAELRSLGLRASQEGGNPLTDSTAVQIILAALRFAEHPGDSASRFFVASTPLGESLGLKARAVDSNGPVVASAIRRRLLGDGLGSVIADWTEALSPHVGDRDQERLQKLAEFAFVREAEDSLRPTAFVERVEKQKFEDPSAEPIRVMTIHQAKGLEFDIVMLPELDEKLVGQTPNYISWASKKGGMTDGVVRYVDKTVQSLLPERIRNAFEDRIVREAQESLCLLYVAVTRAARSLLVVTEPSAANEKTIPLTMAGVLRGALTPPGPLPPDAVWYEKGDPNWRL